MVVNIEIKVHIDIWTSTRPQSRFQITSISSYSDHVNHIRLKNSRQCRNTLEIISGLQLDHNIDCKYQITFILSHSDHVNQPYTKVDK